MKRKQELAKLRKEIKQVSQRVSSGQGDSVNNYLLIRELDDKIKRLNDVDFFLVNSKLIKFDTL